MMKPNELRVTACEQYPYRTLHVSNFSIICAPTATRTRDLLLRRQSLYPLSYRGLPPYLTCEPRGALPSGWQRDAGA